MQLDCNTAGAWKTVSVFDLADLDTVQRAINTLGVACANADSRTTWRIRDGADRVYAYWQGPEKLWQPRMDREDITP